MKTPAHIFIIRHAEKPGEAHIDGPNDGPNLSVRGHTRAQGIGLHRPFPHDVDHVFATRKTKGSVRPIETIAPFAAAVGKVINRKFADEDFEKLAKKLLTKQKYHGKVIVIAWHHGKIPKLIAALNGSITVQPIAKGKWDENTFDRIIHLDYTGVPEGTGKPKTESLPQKLLFGDTEE